MNIIELNNVSKVYKSSQVEKIALNNINLSIEKGEFLGVIGASGSGKTTLLNILGCMDRITSGGYFLYSKDVSKLNTDELSELRNKTISFVFQHFALMPTYNVYDNVELPLSFRKMSNKEKKDKVLNVLRNLGIESEIDKYPNQLSGGQKQRVAIAGVLAMNLNIIILDEATSMLDPKGKVEINELIEQLHKKTNLTIVSITHDMEEVTKSDHVVVLDDGKVKMQGKPSEVLLKEDELVASKLDIPFALKLQKELGNAGIEVKKQITIEGIVDELCQLHSNN